jgi:hypothetical protein
MKTLKIPNDLHSEVKLCVAKSKTNETISDFVYYALLAELKNRGIKFKQLKNKPL